MTVIDIVLVILTVALFIIFIAFSYVFSLIIISERRKDQNTNKNTKCYEKIIPAQQYFDEDIKCKSQETNETIERYVQSESKHGAEDEQQIEQTKYITLIENFGKVYIKKIKTINLVKIIFLILSSLIIVAVLGLFVYLISNNMQDYSENSQFSFVLIILPFIVSFILDVSIRVVRRLNKAKINFKKPNKIIRHYQLGLRDQRTNNKK